MKNVLITSEYFGKFSNAGRKLLTEAGLNVIDNPYGHKRLKKDEIIPYVENASAVICDLEPIDRDVIAAAPKLEIIARRGVGIDSVDYEYARQHGIEVARTMGVVEAPVAELVMCYILDMSRNVSVMSRYMHGGEWKRVQSHSVYGATLGIVGMGNIGMEVARRAHAFGMHIVYYDVRDNKKAEVEFDATHVSFSELLSSSDFVSLHVPLIPSTYGMINDNVFEQMRSNAYLINTARGAIVDIDALKRALENGKIAGAAIDVYNCEPDTNSPLKGMPNVWLTPHIGTFTEEVFINMDIIAAQNVIRKISQK